MIKFENNKATIEGSGEELMVEFGKLTNALKSAIVANDVEKDANFAEYLLFTAFKAGLDAPIKKVGKKDDEPDFIKMLDDLIESIKKGD